MWAPHAGFIERRCSLDGGGPSTRANGGTPNRKNQIGRDLEPFRGAVFANTRHQEASARDMLALVNK